MKTALFGKEKIKILFIRLPYHLWPIINESDNFLLPLGFPCLGAYVKQKMEKKLGTATIFIDKFYYSR